MEQKFIIKIWAYLNKDIHGFFCFLIGLTKLQAWAQLLERSAPKDKFKF